MNYNICKAILILILLTFLAISSLSASIANLFAQRANQAEIRWQNTDLISLSEWQSSIFDLRFALLLSPSNPDYLQTLGRFFYYQNFLPVEKTPEIYMRGLPYLRNSIQVRPYWPYAWADLALIKSLAGELDDEFDQALRLAEKYGPWEKQVINSLILTYFRVWGALTESQKVRAHALVLRILDYDEQSAKMGLDLALETELNPFLCVDQYQKIKSFGLQEFCPDFDDDPSNMPLIFPVQ